jgi:hypothetical protein
MLAAGLCCGKRRFGGAHSWAEGLRRGLERRREAHCRTWTLSAAHDLLEATQGPRCKREHRLQRLSSLAVGPVREG